MIKPLLKNLVLVVAVIGGSVGAAFLKGQGGGSNAEHSSHAKADSHGKEDSHGKSSSKGEKEDSHGGGSYDSVSYLKFKRQFIIPVMENKRIKELVIMNFNVELNEQAPGNSLNLEPKLRDAFIKDLLDLSNQGVFSGDITSPQTYEILRSTLMTSSRRILPDGVENILILDMAKQET